MPVTVTPEERGVLETMAVSRTAPYRQVQRARLLLAAAAGKTNQAISQEIGLGWQSVSMWRRRFIRERLAGLEDRPRPGKPRQYSDADRLRVIETACTQKPEAESHWSVRTLAQATAVGRDTVHRILRQVDLKPHQVGIFSRSPDPDFAAKVVDVVGLYLHPPEHAVVVCVDEKTQVQALDRTQPLLPMRPGQIERRTHDYKRNGTVQLYAALEVHAGRVIHSIEERHRSKEFIAFMAHLLHAYPSGELHVILDNVSSHERTSILSNMPRRGPTPRKVADWKAVQAARRRGLAIQAIARELGMSRGTVRKYLAAPGPTVYSTRSPAHAPPISQNTMPSPTLLTESLVTNT